MKKLIVITLTLLALSCKAQTVLPLYKKPSTVDLQGSYYLKDMDNDMDAYVGTWQWINGNTSLTIQLIKVEMVLESVNVYCDFLLGEYRYVENGVEKVNTLPVTYTTGEDPYNYNINIGHITTVNRGFPPCLTCTPDTRYMQGYFRDPTVLDSATNEPLSAKLYMVHTVDNGVEKLIIRIFDPYVYGKNGPTEMNITSGRYTLIKQ